MSIRLKFAVVVPMQLGVLLLTAPSIAGTTGDYDGDGRADMAVFRPSNGTWYTLPSSKPGTFIVQQWGTAGDIPAPGDYDGDGKTDIAVFRPSNGTWYILPSSKPGTFIVQQWGTAGDIPAPGDYDGDRKTDIAVFRPSNGTWYILPSSAPGTFILKQWGTQGDVPVSGDYDRDGKTDFAVWRPSSGVWYILPSSNPSAPIVQQWGTSGDIPVPVDYDGDGKTDIAVWRPSNGTWYIIPSIVPTNFAITQWGTNGDVPVQEPRGSTLVTGAIASTSLFISASQGGTIWLPDGSNVMIPPGALASDQTVTLSEVAILPKQPPNPSIVGVGTGLILSLPIPNPAASLLSSKTSIPLIAAAATPTDIAATIAEPSSSSSSLQGSAPISNLVDSFGSDTFIGASGSLGTGDGMAHSTIPSSLLPGVASVTVSQANTVPGPPPQYGPRSLSGTDWGQYSCPSGDVLVLTHGILSRVEDAFPAKCAGDIQTNGFYDQVVGFNYDYTQDIDVSGKKLASFLDSLAQCPGVQHIDIEAHSEGVPVSISAGAQIQSAQGKIGNAVFLAGPIMGTQMASTASTLLTAALGFPGLGIPVTLSQLYNAEANGLSPGNTELASDRLKFASNLPNVTVLEAAGDVPLISKRADNFVFPSGTPNDGVVETSSAVPQGSGLPNESQFPTFPVNHLEIECDSNVKSSVGAQLALGINPTKLFFVATGGSNPPSQILNLNNPRRTMAWSAYATTAGSGSWLTVSPTSGITSNQPSVTVSVDASTLAAGSYSGSIVFMTAQSSNVSMTRQVPVTLTVTSQSLSGIFAGTIVSDPSGPCPGSASESGTITGTLSPTGNGSSISIAWVMTQGSGICHDYSGSYNLTGGVDPSGNVVFTNNGSSFFLGGMGTLSKGQITGGWGMGAIYPGSTCLQNQCNDGVTGGSFTISVQ